MTGRTFQRIAGRLALAVCALLGAATAAQSQGTARVPRVGIIAATSPALARHQVDAFRDGLRALGYLRVAKALGLAIPPSLLARADHVLE